MLDLAVKRPILIMPFVTLAASLAFAAEPTPQALVKQGNAALEQGDFDKALEAYKQAEISKPDSAELAYNQAVAYYRQRDFTKAQELFGKALSTRDIGLEAKAKFNLGNCKYAEALEKMTNLQEAIDSLRGAIEYYVDALELAPDDRDARANIETAQLLIKDLLDKLKNQQQQNPTSQPNQQQDQDEQQDQNQQQGEKQEQQQGEQSQDQEQQEKEQQQQQQQGEQGQDEEQQEQQQDHQGEQQEERQLTEEEAQRLLQGVRDRERERRDERGKRIRGTRPKVTKDW